MAKYRLKDQELQKKLDEISGGSFTESLESIKKPSCIVFQARNGGPAMSVNLTKQDIEQFLEYNPNDWNIWPEVAPPKDVYMRVELRTKGTDLDTPEPRLGKVYFRGCGYWDGREWIVLGCHVLPDSEVRYQPWG